MNCESQKFRGPDVGCFEERHLQPLVLLEISRLFEHILRSHFVDTWPGARKRGHPRSRALDFVLWSLTGMYRFKKAVKTVNELIVAGMHTGKDKLHTSNHCVCSVLVSS